MQKPLRVIRVAIVAASALALAVGWYDTMTAVSKAEREAIDRLGAQAVVQARAAGEAAQGEIERFDFALKILQAAKREPAAQFSSQSHFVASAMPADLLLQVFVVGRDGYLDYSSLGRAPRNFLGDRGYFRELAAAGEDRLVISTPVVGRLTKAWTIQLVRPLYRDGRFDGVVALAISAEGWVRRMLRFEAHALDTLTLFDGGGSVLLHSPGDNQHLGRQMPSEREYWGQAERREGHYVMRAVVDGVLRVHGWTRLPSGLVMASGIALEPALQPVRALRSRLLMRSTISSGLFVFVVAALLLALGRYERAVGSLGEREEHYRSLLEHMAEGLVVLDADYRIVSVNPAFSAITGFTSEEVMQRPVTMLSNGRTLDNAMNMLSATDASGHWEGDFEGVRADGEGYTGHAVVSSLRDANGEVRHRVALLTDVTERRRKDDEIWRQANFDRLTGLPNRALLADRLESMLRHARRHRSGVAVLFVDLDRFKPINDEFGHDVGDLLLRQAARRLQGVFREEDTVARIGGDEFIVVMQGEDCAAGAERAAVEVVAQLSQPFFVDNYKLRIGCSVGVACFPQDGDSAEGLVNAADRAMYRAKNSGRGRWSR